MRGTLMGGVVALAMAAAAPAGAATINEAADFATALASPSAVGTLDLGANTIAGSVTVRCSIETRTGCDGTFGDNGDAVSFLVPGGAVLTTASVIIANLMLVDADGFSFPTPLRAARAAGVSSTGLDSFGTTSNATLPLLAGGALTGEQRYRVFTEFFANPGEDSVVSFTWTLNLTVEAAAVPAQGGVPVLLAGIMALSLVRRRR